MILPSFEKHPHLRGGPESRPKLALLSRQNPFDTSRFTNDLLVVRPRPPPPESCESLGSHWLWCEWTVAVRANIYDGSMNDDHFRVCHFAQNTKGVLRFLMLLPTEPGKSWQ